MCLGSTSLQPKYTRPSSLSKCASILGPGSSFPRPSVVREQYIYGCAAHVPMWYLTRWRPLRCSSQSMHSLSCFLWASSPLGTISLSSPREPSLIWVCRQTPATVGLRYHSTDCSSEPEPSKQNRPTHWYSSLAIPHCNINWECIRPRCWSSSSSNLSTPVSPLVSLWLHLLLPFSLMRTPLLWPQFRWSGLIVLSFQLQSATP